MLDQRHGRFTNVKTTCLLYCIYWAIRIRPFNLKVNVTFYYEIIDKFGTAKNRPQNFKLA